MRLLSLFFSLVCVACGGENFASVDGGGDGATSTEAGGGDGGGTIPITIVQATSTHISAQIDPSVSFNTPPVAGNAVIVGITCFSDIDNCTMLPGSVTDNQMNTYVRVIEGDSIISQPTHGSRGYIFIAESIRAPMGTFTITANPNGSPMTNTQNFAWGAIEVSGLAPMNTVDRTGMKPNSCCEPMTTVAISAPTTVANELAVAVHTARSSQTDFMYVSDPSWVQHHVNPNGATTASQHSMVTKIVTTTGPVNHTWTHAMPSRGAAAIIATFKGR